MVEVAAIDEMSTWRETFANNPVAMLVVGPDGRVDALNAACSALTGQAPRQALGQPVDEVLKTPDLGLWDACRGGAGFDGRLDIQHGSGTAGRVGVHASPLSTSGQMVISLTDLTEQKFLELQLREAQQRLGAAFRHAPIGMALCSETGSVLEPNPELVKMFGSKAADVLGKPLRSLVDDGSLPVLDAALDEVVAAQNGARATIEVRLAGEPERWAQFCIASVSHDHDAVGYIILQAQDVSERRRAEAALRHATVTDALTGLANRTLLRDRLQQALHRRRRHQHDIAVMFLDLDHFKLINDTHGHDVGDKVLSEIARRLGTAVRPEDTVARIGGDEFVILLEDLRHGIDEAILVARRIHEVLDVPIELPGGVFTPTASIGIAEATETSSADRLLREADTAMYRAKANGRSCHALFDDSLRQEAMGRLSAQRLIRDALAEDRVVVCYQPVIDLEAGELVGAEALVRIRGRDGELIAPWKFLDAAEETGLIVPMGEVVLRTATQQAADWRAQRPQDDFHIAVNVSLRQLDATFVDTVRSALEDSGLPASALVLEVTESILLDASGAVPKILAHLHDLGIQLALDDFGTGYSSLTTLRAFPIDIVKADRSFVSRAATDDADLAIVETVVELGNKLGMKVVAEGVETAADLRMLGMIGAHFAQGYLFGKPVVAEEFEPLLHRSVSIMHSAVKTHAQAPGEGATIIPMDRTAAG